MGESRRRVGRTLWRVALVSLGVALLLKWGVVDGFEVRGNSMEPLLRDRLGSPDYIAVFKRHFDLFEPRRFDLAVFDRPEGEAGSAFPTDLTGDRYVKRVIAFPGESVLIQDGDVFVGGGEEGSASMGRPVSRKPEDLLQSLQPVSTYFPPYGEKTPWLTPAEFEVADGSLFLQKRDEEGAADVAFRYGEFITDDWRNETTALQVGSHRVNDTALRLEFLLGDEGSEVVLELREQGDTFLLRLLTGAPPVLERRRGPTVEKLETPVVRNMVAGQWVSMVFANIDNQLLVEMDGALLFSVPYENNTEVSGLAARNDPGIWLEKGTFRIRGLEVLRDVYYSDDEGTFGVEKPYLVPEGEYFLLGDNSVNSRDSRHFGSVPKSRFQGRPILIFRPLGRWKVL